MKKVKNRTTRRSCLVQHNNDKQDYTADRFPVLVCVTLLLGLVPTTNNQKTHRNKYQKRQVLVSSRTTNNQGPTEGNTTTLFRSSSPFLCKLLLSVRLAFGPPQQVARRNCTMFAKKQAAPLTLGLRNDGKGCD